MDGSPPNSSYWMGFQTPGTAPLLESISTQVLIIHHSFQKMCNQLLLILWSTILYRLLDHRRHASRTTSDHFCLKQSSSYTNISQPLASYVSFKLRRVWTPLKLFIFKPSSISFHISKSVQRHECLPGGTVWKCVPQCPFVRFIAFETTKLQSSWKDWWGRGMALAGFSLSLRFGFLDELQTTTVGSDGTFYNLLCLKQTKA